ncbi:hypothetical protein ACETU7_31815 [Rhodococcus sp. 3Y1]
MDSREAWQLDSEDLKGEVLDLVRARHELQSRMVLLIVEMFSGKFSAGRVFGRSRNGCTGRRIWRSVSAACWSGWRGC